MGFICVQLGVTTAPLTVRIPKQPSPREQFLLVFVATLYDKGVLSWELESPLSLFSSRSLFFSFLSFFRRCSCTGKEHKRSSSPRGTPPSAVRTLYRECINRRVWK